MNNLYGTLYREALKGDADCGNLLAYCFHSGEHIMGLEEGRPLFVRSTNSKFTLANFMRAQLSTCLGALHVGMNILYSEGVKLNQMLGHGGLFKTAGVGQRIMAAAVNVPVAVMATAGEGGPWGIALLASYMKNKAANETLENFLATKVFGDNECTVIDPTVEDVEGFKAFMEEYKNGIEIEKVAIEYKK